MPKKVTKAKVKKDPVSHDNEDDLPVMSADDCESFDPSANKIAKSITDEEEWEDIDESDDITVD